MANFHHNAFFFLLGILILAGIAGALVSVSNELKEDRNITSFTECAEAGNPVMESYPRQCRTKDGRLFVEDVPPVEVPTNPDGPIAKDGCVITGCSSQVCADEEFATTCEFLPEYACFQVAGTVCERQSSGSCGWTQTPDLQMCIEKARAEGGDVEVNSVQ